MQWETKKLIWIILQYSPLIWWYGTICLRYAYTLKTIKHCREKWKVIWINEKIYHVYGLENNVFFKNFIYLFLEGKGGRKTERNINVWLPLVHPLLGTCPETQACALVWEWNWQPFGSQACSQSTEPHQPVLDWKTYC